MAIVSSIKQGAARYAASALIAAGLIAGGAAAVAANPADAFAQSFQCRRRPKVHHQRG